MVQLFYGWLQDYLKAGLLQPLPAERLQRGRDRARVLPDRPADEGRREILCAADRRALAGAVLEQDAVQGSRARPRTAAGDARRARRLREEADQAQPQRRSAAGRTHDRHGRPGSSLAARGADPPVRRRALLVRQEDRRVQHRRRRQRHAVVHRPRGQAEGRADRIPDRRRHRVPLGQGGDDHRRLVPPGRARRPEGARLRRGRAAVAQRRASRTSRRTG